MAYLIYAVKYNALADNTWTYFRFVLNSSSIIKIRLYGIFMKIFVFATWFLEKSNELYGVGKPQNWALTDEGVLLPPTKTILV